MDESIEIRNLENAKWTAEVGPSINDPVADNYKIVQVNDRINLVMCNSKPYAGWLAKQVTLLPVQASEISFRYTMMIDDCTKACAQVAETDSKITDKDRWTYDLSNQWLMRKEGVTPNWMFQIDNQDWTWTDTGIIIPPFNAYEPKDVVVDYFLDYTNKKSAVTAVHVGSKIYDVSDKLWWIPAREEGWAPSEIVTQLQQCNNSEPGGYTLQFHRIGYSLSGW